MFIYPVIIGRLYHVDEMTQVVRFEAAGRAEDAFVYADSVDLKLHHRSPGTDDRRVIGQISQYRMTHYEV